MDWRLTAVGVGIGVLALSTALAHTTTVDIVITESGFAPAEISVDTQTTVTFSNQGKTDHWPASNQHPTHDLYPEFDPMQAIAPGGAWSFRPAKAGHWQYHDHLNPRLTGMLTVHAEAAPAEVLWLARWWQAAASRWKVLFSKATLASIPSPALEIAPEKIEPTIRAFNTSESQADYVRDVMTTCFKAGGRNTCYKAAAQRFFEAFGLRESLRLLSQNESHPDVYARCHEVTHYLSRQEFERRGSVPEVYAACDSTCHGGCYHGAMESYLAKVAAEHSTYGLAARLTEVCGTAADYAKPIIYNECLHGLGHAAMFVTNADVRQSLKLCDNLAEAAERERCYSGVFMENSSSSTNIDHPSLYLKADDPNFPCTILDKKYVPLCYRYQSSHFSILTHYDWKKVGELCLGVPAPYQEECFRTVGTNQVGYKPDKRVWRDDCIMMPEAYQATCVKGVVSSLSYRFVGDTVQAENFCYIVPASYQESCIKQLAAGIRDWSSVVAEQEDWCQALSEETFRAWCREELGAS